MIGSSALTAASALLVLALSTLACDSESSAAPEVTPGPSATATVAAPVGSARASINALCELTKVGAQLNVSYRASASGGAQISRVRIQLDGSVVQDTGAMLREEFEGVTTLYVAPGSAHAVTIVANAPGLPPIAARYSLRCPAPLPRLRA